MAKFRALANLAGGEIKKDQIVEQAQYERLNSLEKLRLKEVKAQVTVFLDADQPTSEAEIKPALVTKRSRLKTSEKRKASQTEGPEEEKGKS